MLITSSYILWLVLALGLTVLAWTFDSVWLAQRTHVRAFRRLRNLTVFFLTLIILWLCYSNFPVTLTLLVMVTGFILLMDILFFRRKRKAQNFERPWVVENSYAFFGVLLLVWVIRSFVVQPYRVPTGSLQPTILPGDFIGVNQYAFGLHFPIGNIKFISIGEPKRGEIVLFFAPHQPEMVLVKRLIGLPGDHIEYRNKVLYINGKEIPQTPIGLTMDNEPAVAGNPEEHIPVMESEENLLGIKHRIFVALNGGMTQNIEVVVPPGHYFMMGDNRDNSGDSRVWGFVPEQYLIGRAIGVFMSWDSLQHRVRWERIGNLVK